MSDLKVDGFKVCPLTSPERVNAHHIRQASEILATLSATFSGLTDAERAAQIKKVTSHTPHHLTT